MKSGLVEDLQVNHWAREVLLFLLHPETIKNKQGTLTGQTLHEHTGITTTISECRDKPNEFIDSVIWQPGAQYVKHIQYSTYAHIKLKKRCKTEYN